MSVVAKSTGRVAGSRALLRAGRLYADDDPMVLARPDLFESPESYQARKNKPQSTAELGNRSMSARARGVESARRAPGEVRDLDYPCPHDECDWRGTSERGLKGHITKAHGS